MARYTYGKGYTSSDTAFDAMSDMFAEGEISRGEFPQVESYLVRLNSGQNAKRFKITLVG